MKNNWKEIARVFIQVKVYLRRSLGQLERGGLGRGSVQVEEQAVGGKQPQVEACKGEMTPFYNLSLVCPGLFTG